MGLMGRVVLFGEGADAEDTLSRLVEALRYFQCKRLSLQELRLLSSQGYRVECDVLLVAFSADAACPEIVAEVRRCAGEAGVVVLSPEAKTDSGPSLLTAGADLWLPSTTEPLLLQASIAARRAPSGLDTTQRPFDAPLTGFANISCQTGGDGSANASSSERSSQ